jgi:hypothetical protein
MCREELKLLAVALYVLSVGSLVIACVTGTAGLFGVAIGCGLAGICICGVISFKN